MHDVQMAGNDVESVEAMITLAGGSHALAIRLIRTAAVMTGDVLATIVNFFNSDRLVLADSSVFVAGVRPTLFADGLPAATEKLSVDVASDQSTGGLHGAARIFVDQIFGEWVNEAVTPEKHKPFVAPPSLELAGVAATGFGVGPRSECPATLSRPRGRFT